MNKKSTLRVALIGTYPPPYGGRSIHLQRLKDFLETQNVKVIVYNTGRTDNPNKNIFRIGSWKIWLLRQLLSTNKYLLHYHGTNWKRRASMGLLGFLGKKTIVSLHSSIRLPEDLRNASWLKRGIILFGLKHTSLIIADNNWIKDFVLSLGISVDRIATILNFIPPITKEGDDENIPSYVWTFFRDHEPVICGNASSLCFYNGIDLYGLDMVVELVAQLKPYYPRIGFVFSLATINDEEYFNKIKSQIEQYDLSENFLFIAEGLSELYPIIRASDIFVRPTITDGDAISIREALSFNIPVVASDGVMRPRGVVLFKNRNIEDFTQKVKEILCNYDEWKNFVARLEAEIGTQQILQIYNKLSKPSCFIKE